MIIVSDTSSLNALFKIDQISLLPALYQQVLIPERVWEEMLRDEAMQRWLQHRPEWLTVQAIHNRQRYLDLLDDMDEGEAEAIVLMLETQADRLLLDDQEGRAKATELGLPVIGTLGVLLQAKQQGLLTRLRPHLDDLISKAKFRISETLRTRVLALAGEQTTDNDG
ncbi:DUF3368 domain-containing protein [Rudanella lutea]|uniref:DUF3368 domain-containing protein n=1 Tax=Rudanella lutea TaxID=451374 RepID=UPI000369B379|nr:DUF3368 domain-containing protein [Rudanella lutea]